VGAYGVPKVGKEAEQISGQYVTGLVEGEGCFCVSFTLRNKLRLGIETRPSFSISLNRRDLELLKQIQAFFKCGAIRYSQSDRTFKFEVRSVAEIVEKVLPHFEAFPCAEVKSKTAKGSHVYVNGTC
jgi:hypothetical protein